MKELEKFKELRMSGVSYSEALEKSGYSKLISEKKVATETLSQDEFTQIL